MGILITTLNAVLPSFVLMFCGWGLRKTNLVSHDFLAQSGRLVFYLALPTLIMLKFYEADSSHHFPVFGLTVCVVATTLFCIIAWIIAKQFTNDPADIGALFQGSTRTNFAVIGLYLIHSMFGHDGLLTATLFLVVTIPINNISSVYVLSHYAPKTKVQTRPILQSILLNPMVLSLSVIPLIWIKPPIPTFLLRAAHDVASLSLPLALISVGASIQFSKLGDHVKVGGIGVVLKLVAMPLFIVGAAVACGIRGLDLVSIALFSATPTATASFILAKRYDSNTSLTGWLIATTTLGSLITLPALIIALRWMHWVP